MNDNNLANNSFNNNNNNTYHATSNLNTAIENPQINVSSATGVNIKDSGYNNYAENNINNNSNFLNNNFNQTTNDIPQSNSSDIQNKYIPTNNDNNYNYNSYSNQNTENYSYEPVMKEKKKEKNALSSTIHSKEFKIMAAIVFILVLFLLLMPYIYDFFRELSMNMTA